MSDSPNALAIFSPEPIEQNPLSEGDVALLIKRDGSVQALTFDYDRSRANLPDAEKTDLDRHMLKQGELLFALALVIAQPQLRQLILDLAADPDVVDPSKINSAARLH